MIPKQMMKIIFNNQSQKLSFSFCKPIYKKSILTPTHIYSFSQEKSDHPKDEKKITQKTEQNNSKIELFSRDQHEIEKIQQQQNKKYSIVKRNYNQTQVPGTETRKYTNLTDLQKDIIANNKFDLLNPQIIPKSGSVNSYIGIKQNLTEISLGSVKVKADDQVFLSQVDPHNIPADLKIRFDSEKQLKIVGKQSKNNKKTSKQDPQNTKMDMAIQSETIEQKTISEHMQQQLGVGVKGYKYFNIKRIRRWDILLTILSIILLMPVYSTFEQLYECYCTTSAIQEQRMKEIKQLKQRSFKRVLFENKDFNKIM